jgi:uncharacterized protein with GYD domain
MAKFLFKVNYTTQGLQGVMKEGGNARKAAAEETIGSVGGTVESFHFAFGDTDVFIIADMPDAAAAASVALNVSATGSVTVETVALLEPNDVDAATGAEVSYRPPGA